MSSTLIVHVILPSGTRFEHTWSDRDANGNHRSLPSDDKILRAIMENKQYYGYQKTIKKQDTDTGLPYPIQYGDPESGFIIDHPDTIVAIVEKDQPVSDNVREIRRLKGPLPSTTQSPSPTQPPPATPTESSPVPTTPSPTLTSESAFPPSFSTKGGA